jgi:hypothetical protein
MLTYSQFAFVAALISTVLATIAYAWAMSAGHRAATGASKRKVLVTAHNHLPCNVGEFRTVDLPLAMKDAREILEACKGKAVSA